MPEMTKCEGAVNKEQKPCSDKSKCTKADSATPPAPTEQKKLKPCCACPETKKPRDQCIVEHGEENCTELIEAHKQCMRKMGFNI